MATKFILSKHFFVVYKHSKQMQSNLNSIQPLHHHEINNQVEVIPILCAMGGRGLQPEVDFSNFLALQISNAVSQTLDSNNQYS